MEKDLSEMTLDELWQLFPIILKEYNPEYPKWYEIEKENLMNHFHDSIIRINHIGSTAVPGIISKPTIDILMEVSNECNLNEIQEKLIKMGWTFMYSSDNPFMMTFNKGYTKHGFAEKVYHLHFRLMDNWDELYFRDYIKEHNDVAYEYVALKLKLKELYEHNRDAYTDGKTEFIKKYSTIAKLEYGNRYGFHTI